MFCGYCGHQVEAGDKFCVGCGRAIEHAQAPHTVQKAQSDKAPFSDVIEKEKAWRTRKIMTFAILAMAVVAVAMFCCVDSGVLLIEGYRAGNEVALAASILFTSMLWYVAIPLTVACVVFSSIAFHAGCSYKKEFGAPQGRAKVGRVLSIVAFVLSMLIVIFMVMIGVQIFTVLLA